MARVNSRILAAGAITLLLAGCEQLGIDSLLPRGGDETPEVTAAATVPGESVERDVEAPEVFSTDEPGLWDGRPSLGGVWVAHPDVTEPERVIIRNVENDSFVIGALFRRERDNPGPRIQVSSDAAETLGMLAGQPATLSVVALRRQQVAVAPPALEDVGAAEEIAAAGIESTALEPLEGAPNATPAEAPDEAAPVETAAAQAAAPTPPAAPSGDRLDKPFIQIGIFSVEENASNTAASLRNIGIVPTVLSQESNGKPFWRVIVGPTTNAQERRTILSQVQDLGFNDAYFVTN
ncbi:MAG: SPOR domain-containing protein [Pseudomonadota bacterium]